MSYKVKRFNKIGDDEIIWLFVKMDNEGTRKQVFHDGQIQTPWDFLEFVRSGLIWGGFVYDENAEPAACFWVSNITGNVAFFHYWLYKAFWGRDTYKKLAAVATEYIAQNTHLTGLAGQTPATLKLAVRALKNYGFKILGTIPEAIKLYDGTVTDIVISFFDLKPQKEEL
jgi:RimJ/RimL family protein N-acetyltransferase